MNESGFTVVSSPDLNAVIATVSGLVKNGWLLHGPFIVVPEQITYERQGLPTHIIPRHYYQSLFKRKTQQ